MINEIFIDILNLIITFISLILKPIDELIFSLLPDLSSALSSVGSLFNYISTSIAWCVSLTGLSSASLTLIVIYYTFKLTAPMLFYSIKLAISWFNKLKI